jgi:hypothetical protein
VVSLSPGKNICDSFLAALIPNEDVDCFAYRAGQPTPLEGKARIAALAAHLI